MGVDEAEFLAPFIMHDMCGTQPIADEKHVIFV